MNIVSISDEAYKLVTDEYNNLKKTGWKGNIDDLISTIIYLQLHYVRKKKNKGL